MTGLTEYFGVWRPNLSRAVARIPRGADAPAQRRLVADSSPAKGLMTAG